MIFEMMGGGWVFIGKRGSDDLAHVARALGSNLRSFEKF